MKVFTTINPNGNFMTQDNAMRSWALRFSVYSINTKDEILKIKDLYPYVSFIETEITYDYKNKKLVKLNSILSSIKDSKTKYCAIVNSDIILNSNMNFDKKILNNGILIGSRYEINGDETYIFEAGYDLFIFDSKNIDLFFNENYVIGMPWWDYWVPIIAIKSMMNIYHIENEVLYHITHETNYDYEIWNEFGDFFYNDILKNNGIWKTNDDVNNLQDSKEQICLAIKKFIESKHINIKVK
jgi:hypothetical protein